MPWSKGLKTQVHEIVDDLLSLFVGCQTIEEQERLDTVESFVCVAQQRHKTAARVTRRRRPRVTTSFYLLL